MIFIRSTCKEDDISTDQINHENYRNNVFLPYVQLTRKNYLRREGWDIGDEVDDDHVWIGWQVRCCLVDALLMRCCCVVDVLLIC